MPDDCSGRLGKSRSQLQDMGRGPSLPGLGRNPAICPPEFFLEAVPCYLLPWADGQGNFAFVIDAPNDTIGFAKKVYVKVEGMTNSGFLIEEGLETGDYLVTAGLQTLFDGQKVRLTN